MNRFSLLLLAGLTGGLALAHETVNAGNVQLEWHTNTNELLQVKGDSVLTLSMKVKDQLLKPSDCRCTVLLYAGEVNPRVKPVILETAPSEEGTLDAVVTAPKAGVYSIVVDAKPVNLNLFTAFRSVIKIEAVEDVYNTLEKK